MTQTLGIYFDATGIDIEVAKSAERLLAERPDLTGRILESLKALKARQFATVEYLNSDRLVASLAECKETQPQTMAEFLEDQNIDVGEGSANEIDEAILGLRANEFEKALGALPNRLGRSSELSIYDLRFLYIARIGRD